MRDFKDLQIAVAGTGYVGLSLAVLLAQHHQVTAVDIVPEKVDLINTAIFRLIDLICSSQKLLLFIQAVPTARLRLVQTSLLWHIIGLTVYL